MNLLLIIVAIFIFAYFMWQIFQNKSGKVRKRMAVVVILLLYAIVFFIIYQQKNTSFMLFNVHHVNLNFLGWQINPQTVPGLLDTGGIIFLSPIITKIYHKLGDKDLALPHKFAIGLFLSSCAYGTLWLACLLTAPENKINFIWEILSISIFFSSSELLISALGVSVMAQLVPDKLRGFSMGMWFITSALGIKLGSFIASMVANKNNDIGIETTLSLTEKISSFHNYQHLFGMIFIFGLIVAVIAWFIRNRLKFLI